MAKINRATMALITLSTALPCFAQSYDDDGAQSFNLILTLFLFLATAIVSFQDNKGIKTSSPGTGKWLWSLIIIPTFFAFLAFAIVINTLFNSDILKIFDTMSIVLTISCVATFITWIILRLAILKRKRTYTEHKHKIFIVFWSCCLIYEIIGCILSSKVYDFAGWEYYEYIAKLLPFNPIEVLGGKLVISWIILMIVSIVFIIIGWRELNASVTSKPSQNKVTTQKDEPAKALEDPVCKDINDSNIAPISDIKNHANEQKNVPSRKRHRLKGLRNSIIITTGIIGIISIILYFAIWYDKYDGIHDDAITKIETENGKILFDGHENGIQHIVYCTDSGLFHWNLDCEQPYTLYNNLEPIVEYSYTLKRDETLGLQANESPLGKYLTAPQSSESSNIFKDYNPKELYRVSWPWILIGSLYVANINTPNKLISIENFKPNDPIFDGLPTSPLLIEEFTQESVSIDDFTSSIVLHLVTANSHLPGFNQYKPSKLPQDLWQWKYGSFPLSQYKGTEQYFDSYSDFQSIYLFNIDDFKYVYRDVYVDTAYNAILSNQIDWYGNQIPSTDLTPQGMNKYYVKAENKLYEKYQQFCSESHRKVIEQIESCALPADAIYHAYRENPYTASEKYPFYHEYLIKIYAENITPGENGYKYKIIGKQLYEVYNHEYIYLFSDDDRFRTLSPQEIVVRATLAPYQAPYEGSYPGRYLFNAELIIWNN